MNDRLDDLPPDVRNELTRYDVIDWNTALKPLDKALVSLCADGIRCASPTTFTMSADNYTPDSDLNMLFVEPMPLS